MLQKKLAFVIPSLAMGGMERVMSEIVNCFSENNLALEIHLIILTRNERSFSTHKDVQIHEPNFDYKDFSRLVYTVKSIKYLRKILKEIQPFAVLSFGDRYNSLTLVSTLFLPIKTYVSNRMNPTLSNGKFIDILNKIMYRFADGIIAQTSFAKEVFLKRYGNKKVIVVPNPIKMIGAVQNKINRENIILNVGRFVDGKNQLLLINYFQEINSTNWKLIFLGNGPNLEEAKRYVESNDLTKFVEFHGNVKNIDAYYQRSKIFAFTSTTEGFPNVLGEAMSGNLACMSFDCVTGPSELIKDGYNGYLVNVLDHKTYVSKLNYLMQNAAVRDTMIANGSEHIKNFSIDKICNLYYQIFDSENLSDLKFY